MSIEFCPGCGASLPAEARFCGECGRETELRLEEQAEKSRLGWQRTLRAYYAIALLFVGSLTGLIVVSIAIEERRLSYLAFCAVNLAICTIALGFLGRNSWRHSLGRAPDGVGYTLAVVAGLVTLPVSYAYASLFAGDGAPREVEASLLAALFFTAVLPALVEEWMCRGVLFIALRPLISRWNTILTTAALFAALHALNGGLILEMPHRFVSGLVYGWLRAKTGSLWPCVLAHFVHNATVVVIAWM